MTDLDELIKKMRLNNMPVPNSRRSFKIPNAKEAINEVMKHFIEKQGKSFVWIKEYDEVSSWLENSNGNGLFLYGNCGLGKSLLANFAIPAIVLKTYGLVFHVYNAREASSNIDGALCGSLICIDDIGTETVSVKFGERRDMFPEVVDSTEYQGRILLATSNLTKDEIITRYGDRIYDRIKSTMVMIPFNGKSFR